jgi:glycosyltransferase involved in cell wall biosynthesis
MHQAHLRQGVNRLLRGLNGGELEFIVMSQGERANLIEGVGISPERIHRVVYRGKSSGLTKPQRNGGYIFTGGYTNRDYATFFAAVAPLQYHIIAVASPFNDLTHATAKVDLRIGTPLDEFEELVAGCGLLVLPLRAGGEACGQSVLSSAIRHRRPVVATRHEALIDYLGDDYPGFVPAHDVDALRSAVVRVVSDHRFRESLLKRIEVSARRLDEMGDLEDEFLRILAPSSRLVAGAGARQ